MDVIIGIIGILFVVLNTVVMAIPVFLFSVIKFISPAKGWRVFWTQILLAICSFWVALNNSALMLLQRTEWDIVGSDCLDWSGKYLIACNHQSWADIPVLQKVMLGHVPFLRFFIKDQLKYMPILGQVWKALDMPFMKRYSVEFLKKNPHKKGEDMLATQKACEAIGNHPVAIINFLEGTRMTPAKHQKQQSHFTHLLKPKAGGLAFAITAMKGKITSLLDVTIVYHHKHSDCWDFLCGRMKKISVHIKHREIPSAFLFGDYSNDPDFKARFQAWVNGLWDEKDELISKLKVCSAADLA